MPNSTLTKYSKPKLPERRFSDREKRSVIGLLQANVSRGFNAIFAPSDEFSFASSGRAPVPAGRSKAR